MNCANLRLPAARRTDDVHHFAELRFQIYVTQSHCLGFSFAKPLVETASLDRHLRHVILGKYQTVRSARPGGLPLNSKSP